MAATAVGATAASLPRNGAACGSRSLAARPRHVAFANGFSPEGRERLRELFGERGFVVGRDLELSFVNVHDAPRDDVEPLIRRIVASRPDVIAMLAGDALFLLSQLAGDIPIVFYNLGVDPVAMGLVRSMRSPGGTITGTSHRLTDMVPKFWELLKELQPGMKRGGLLMTRGYVGEKHVPALRQAMEAAASGLGITLVEIVVADEGPFPVVAQAIRRARVDAFLLADTASWLDELLAFAQASRTSGIYTSPWFVRRGGLASLSPDFLEGERHAVRIISRILAGESPANIPVYEATRYHLALNLRAAGAMGLVVPPSVLLRADEVIR